MRHSFALFHSHLDLAHHHWSLLVQKGDSVIDATCGNGYDTLKLCQLALATENGKVFAFDIQNQAIESARTFVENYLPPEHFVRVEFQKRCHATFPTIISRNSIKLIVYNLGYLPGGDKTLTTRVETTIQSLNNALDLLVPGGGISITCYPGHPEGAKELHAILSYVSQLSPKEWSCCHHTWLNRQQSPSLLLIQKSC